MKVIYRKEFTYTLNNNTHIHTEYGSWHYGEPPKDYSKEYTLKELKEYVCGYAIERLFSFQPYRIRLCYCEESIKEKNFINAITYVKHKPIGYEYTIEDLIKHLSADDFADWCRDKSICNICLSK